MGGGVQKPHIRISKKGELYYANLRGNFLSIGVGRTPVNAAKNLMRDVRKMILREVETYGLKTLSHID